ncbi:DsbC family protein [Thermodesulfovibrio yellowstonii]|uniref:DsbC family protein n=1 Tax=Thermodesulfovibrio yellowstonii TaxID=28262 RepID=UPI000418249D|nr:DsbC family protein [Thermodesulfovibrio islandicus]
MKKLSVVLAVLILMVAVACHAQNKPEDVAKELQRIFPNFQVESVSESPVPGVYEVVGTSGQILYWSPKGYLIFGEIWTKEGKSLTAERRQELQAKKIKEIPLDKAVKVGSGPIQVITFTDPACPFCKRGYDYMSKRADVTEYLFLLPFQGKASEDRIAYILCAKDREKAYKEVMENPQKEVKVSQDCKEKAKPIVESYYLQAAQKVGIGGTPTYFINDKMIPGINIPLIEDALKSKK